MGLSEVPYDPNDTVNTYSVDGQDRTYQYDDNAQLTRAIVPERPTEEFSYDANGNRTNFGYTTGPDNRLRSDDTASYRYDAEGNRTVRTGPALGETAYAWDSRNRLTSIGQSGGLKPFAGAYVYDTKGRRVRQTVTGTPGGKGDKDEWYVWDGQEIALVLDGTGKVRQRYLFGPGIDEVLAEEHVTDDFAAAVDWMFADRQGSVRRVLRQTFPINTAVAVSVPDGSFERPNVGSGYNAYTYRPTGTAWTFAGDSGVSGNYSDFTFENGLAPDGTQVGVLQQQGSFAQTISVPSAGTYVMTFKAAERPGYNGANPFRVLMNGHSLGQFKPVGKNYLRYSTDAFSLASGDHNVEFQGLNAVSSGDKTSFVDDVRLEPANAAQPSGPVTTEHLLSVDYDAFGTPIVTNLLADAVPPPAEGVVVYDEDFEDGIVGPEWTIHGPAGGNLASRQAGTTPVGGRRFLGELGGRNYRNPAARPDPVLGLDLAALPAHSEVTVELDLYVLKTWGGNENSRWGLDLWELALRGGPTLLKASFSNYPADIGYDSHLQSYPDPYVTPPPPSHPGQTGAREKGTLGYVDGHGLASDSVYRLSFTFAHAADALALDFFSGADQGLGDESWGLDDVKVTLGGTAGVWAEPSPPRFLYTGREWDAAGLYQYRARYHDPAAGRFLSPDPLGHASGDTNGYRYVFNSPPNYTDPGGMVAFNLAKRAGSAVSAFAGPFVDHARRIVSAVGTAGGYRQQWGTLPPATRGLYADATDYANRQVLQHLPAISRQPYVERVIEPYSAHGPAGVARRAANAAGYAAYEHRVTGWRGWVNAEAAVLGGFATGTAGGLVANVNAAADTIVSTATLGWRSGGGVIGVRSWMRADYDTSYASARVGYEVLTGVVTGGLSALKAGSTVVRAIGYAARGYDLAGNAQGVYGGVNDAAHAGLNWSNATQIVGGGLGSASTVIRVPRSANPHRLHQGPVHHIATDKGAMGRDFQRLFDSVGLDLQSPYNRMRISNHAGPHGIYNNLVFTRLDTAVRSTPAGAGRQALIDELKRVRRDIRHNDWDALLGAAAGRAEREYVRSLPR